MKLQQWDILNDLARHENHPDIMIESAWRLVDSAVDRDQVLQSIRMIPDEPHYKAIEAFYLLPDIYTESTRNQFHKICEDGLKLALNRWHSLPPIVSRHHDSTLHLFQQLVELQEAFQIHTYLYDTNATNFDVRHQEVKSYLQSWRERLPNPWDDINLWSDLVSWRQLVFHSINRIYLSLAPMLSQPAANGTNSNVNSFVYRGYHETACIINRFSRVARKHELFDVCNNQLARIYTLPNIEIQEAFIKLSEQAKCHYSVNDLAAGLDVINNTNLLYFNARQKAEFFSMKGMFMSKMNMLEEANTAFSTATQLDLNHPKAWAAWGFYYDHIFTQRPTEVNWGVKALECYLQAASIHRHAKSRRYITRILWLLGLDNSERLISKAFENFKGDVPIWYWLSFIPQLLCALYYHHGKQIRLILMKIAKIHPQVCERMWSGGEMTNQEMAAFSWCNCMTNEAL